MIKPIPFLTCFGAGLVASLAAQSPEPIRLQVDAAKTLATVTKQFNGTNIEDLNFQTAGGIFSQLIHGEAFEENVDIDFLHLPLGDYVKVHVILDEMRTPHFFSVANAYNRPIWNNLTEKYDFNLKDLHAHVAAEGASAAEANSAPKPSRSLRIGPLEFKGRFMLNESMPEAMRQELEQRVNGSEQISRYWSKLVAGRPAYAYELKRGDAYMGRQDQMVRFLDGEGEVGLYNAGLNKQGINLVAGRPYEGIIRLKSPQKTTLYLSLRDETGRVLAERACAVAGDGSWERVAFELTPERGTPRGRFGLSLKSKGEVELGYAFLQAGAWGRVQGLPVRREFVAALKRQGISVIRYNGSMVDVGADTYLYRWKKMLGPVDERRVCFRSGFNPYATHSCGVIELLQVAEALEAQAMVGLSMDETYEDIRDFVEYVNGPVTSRWGALRARHGHPEPYRLKYIQVDNERQLNRGYAAGMKKFARAAWEVDPEMHVVASLNIGTRKGSYARGTPEYALATELFGWFVAQGKSDRMVWDPHYSGAVDFADSPAYPQAMGIVLQADLARDYPGHKLTLCPMEENGQRCDWNRGLAHAHNWNTHQRHGNCFTWLGTANTFQAHGQHYMWNQGRVHFTSSEIWFQPSALIDEKMIQDWLPVVVEATSSRDAVLDVTAKTDAARSELALYVVNLSATPQLALINVEGFAFAGPVATWTIGDCDFTDYNTAENQTRVAPKTGTVTLSRRDATYLFPKYSYTILTLRRAAAAGPGTHARAIPDVGGREPACDVGAFVVGSPADDSLKTLAGRSVASARIPARN